MVTNQRKASPRRTASEEDEVAWQQLVSDRYVETYNDLPAAAQVVIAAAAVIILTAFPTSSLFITGSRIEGTYLDETDSEETARLRAENIYKTGVSDYDIQVEGVGDVTNADVPNLPANIEISNLFTGRKIAIPNPI